MEGEDGGIGARAARERLARPEAGLEEVRGRHLDAALIRSLAGMGLLLTAQFIAETGDTRGARRPDHLAAAAGPAPILRQSGRMRHMVRGRGGAEALERVLDQPARCFLTTGGPDRADLRNAD